MGSGGCGKDTCETSKVHLIKSTLLEKSLISNPKGMGGGGYSGFQVTGMI